MGYQRRGSSKKTANPIAERVIGLIVSLVFAVPTAILIWFATNKNLALLGSSNTLLGSDGFWLILGVFALVAVILPNFFPSLLGKIWHTFIKIENWF